MPFTPTEIQAVAAAESAKITELSLHTADPGTTGANEATGGSYARVTTTVTATNGTGTSTQVTFNAPAGTFTHFGAWAGATFLGGDPLDAPVTINPAGQVKFTLTLPVTSS